MMAGQPRTMTGARRLAAWARQRTRALTHGLGGGRCGGVVVGVSVSPQRLACVMIRPVAGGFEVLGVAGCDLAGQPGPGDAAVVGGLRELLASLPALPPRTRIFAALWNAATQVRLVTTPEVAPELRDTAAFFAARKALDFGPETSVVDIEARGPWPSEDGVRRLGALACVAAREDVEALEAAFARSGRRLAGITLTPLGLQHLLRRGSARGEVAANLHLGRAWSRLELCDRGALVAVRSLRTGQAGFAPGDDGAGDGAGEALTRLSRQVGLTLGQWCRELGLSMPARLTVSGCSGGPLVEHLGRWLGLPCATLTCPGQDIGPEAAHALGVALAGVDGGADMRLTFRERALLRRGRRVAGWTLTAAAVLLGVVLACAVQARELRQDLVRRAGALEARLAGLGPATDTAALARRLAAVAVRRKALRDFTARNAVVGLWGEVLALAPAGVGVASMTATFAQPGRAVSAAGRGTPAKRLPRLDVTGVVSGEPRFLEALLTRFVAALRRSPCFAHVEVTVTPPQAATPAARDLRFALALGVPEGGL